MHRNRKRKGQSMDPLPMRMQMTRLGVSCYASLCKLPAVTKGLCRAHYVRKHSGRPDWNRPLQPGPDRRYQKVSIRMLRELMDLVSNEASSRGLAPWQALEKILHKHFRLQDEARLPTLREALGKEDAWQRLQSHWEGI